MRIFLVILCLILSLLFGTTASAGPLKNYHCTFSLSLDHLPPLSCPTATFDGDLVFEEVLTRTKKRRRISYSRQASTTRPAMDCEGDVRPAIYTPFSSEQIRVTRRPKRVVRRRRALVVRDREVRNRRRGLYLKILRPRRERSRALRFIPVATLGFSGGCASCVMPIEGECVKSD